MDECPEGVLHAMRHVFDGVDSPDSLIPVGSEEFKEDKTSFDPVYEAALTLSIRLEIERRLAQRLEEVALIGRLTQDDLAPVSIVEKA